MSIGKTYQCLFMVMYLSTKRHAHPNRGNESCQGRYTLSTKYKVNHFIRGDESVSPIHKVPCPYCQEKCQETDLGLLTKSHVRVIITVPSTRSGSVILTYEQISTLLHWLFTINYIHFKRKSGGKRITHTRARAHTHEQNHTPSTTA